MMGEKKENVVTEGSWELLSSPIGEKKKKEEEKEEEEKEEES